MTTDLSTTSGISPTIVDEGPTERPVVVSDCWREPMQYQGVQKWMRAVLASELDESQKAKATEYVMDENSGAPPEWLDPWLTRRNGEWHPAIPDSADVPEVGPVDRPDRCREVPGRCEFE